MAKRRRGKVRSNSRNVVGRTRNRDTEEQTPIGFPRAAVSARMNEEFLCSPPENRFPFAAREPRENLRPAAAPEDSVQRSRQ